jgi:hypothetical protein
MQLQACAPQRHFLRQCHAAIANATLLGLGALLAFLTSPFGLVGFPLAVLCIVHALGPSAGDVLRHGALSFGVQKYD